MILIHFSIKQHFFLIHLAFKIYSAGLESLIDIAVQRKQIKVRKNVRIDLIDARGHHHATKHRINVNDETGKQTDLLYDFIVIADDLKKYIALNQERSQKEYQTFLRPGNKYIVKTLVDSLNIPRGSSPLEFYANTFYPGTPIDYKLAHSIDSYGVKTRRSGDLYKQNLFGNSEDPNDRK